MVVSPEEAGSKNDAAILKVVKEVETYVDEKLQKGWHSNSTILEMPAPKMLAKGAFWAEEANAIASKMYTMAGWKIERKHDPSTWTFKRSK